MGNNAYPSEVRLFARGVFIQGNSYNETAKLVKKQFPGARCNAETISRWANKKDEEGRTWHDSKGVVAKHVEEGQKEDAIKLLERHSALYDLMIRKGEGSLRQKGIAPRSAAEAGSILDTGIKGQRAALKELVALNFVRAVFQIVSEEVVDEAAKRRIALRFRELSESL